MTNTKTSKAGLSREQWLDLRRTGVGGSDVGAIMGFNPWAGILDIYLDKLNKLPQEEENEYMYWGNILEDIVAKEFSKRTGKKVRNSNFMFRSEEYPWMVADVDRIIIGENAGLECKTTNAYGKGQWDGEEIPPPYILQCQHYMAVMGFEKMYIAVLIGGNQFTWKEIQRDEELISIIIEKEKDFWLNFVQKGIPPAADKASEKALEIMYPIDSGEIINLDDEDENQLRILSQLMESKSAIEGQITELQTKIKQKMKDNSYALGTEYKVSYKSSTRNVVDSKKLKEQYPEIYSEVCKTSTTRRFLLKEVK